MALIQWDTSFSVNVKEIDAQHKQLIEIINQLHDAMRSGKGREEIGSIVDKMIDYAQRHFTYEEKLLGEKQYLGLIRQKADHKAFITKANGFKLSAAQGKLALSVEVSDFLKNWWTHHIQIEDKKYSKFLNAKGVE